MKKLAEIGEFRLSRNRFRSTTLLELDTTPINTTR